MKEIVYIFLTQGILCMIAILIMAIIYIFDGKDIVKNHIAFVLCVAIYGFVCLIMANKARHEHSVEEINTYKEYYKNTENMIDAIWELEPEMFDKIDKSQYDTSRNKVYKLNHTNN